METKTPTYQVLLDEYESLRAALSAARRDAERYRWLRSEEACTNPLYYAFWREFEAKLCREKQMDAAIDEAMKLDTHKHPDCEDRCQILEHKGYHAAPEHAAPQVPEPSSARTEVSHDKPAGAASEYAAPARVADDVAAIPSADEVTAKEQSGAAPPSVSPQAPTGKTHAQKLRALFEVLRPYQDHNELLEAASFLENKL